MFNITLPIPDITKELLISKGLTNDESISKFLYPNIKNLYNYRLLDSLVPAINLFITHLERKSSILFYCDYDVDGCCSATILNLGLKDVIRKHGAKAKLKLPTRKEGYGMNKSVLEHMLKTQKIDLIVTADNGIKAVDEIAYCREKGIEVIVLDHHAPDMTNLPNANILVDLHMPNTTYPCKNLCGASVCFKFVLGVIETLGQDTRYVYELLQYAAIATIADVVSLTDENRLIVQLGLQILNNRPAIGIQCLLAELKHEGDITSDTINYKIAPCINAPGRIHIPNTSVQLLVADNEDLAKIKAIEVVNINTRRKELTEEFVNKGFDYIEEKCKNDFAYVVKLDGCPEGIVGLVAGQIKERFNKPTIVLAKHNDNYVGSARSIEAFNINEHLTALSNYLIRFGGHTLAAGLSISEDKIDEFRVQLNNRAKEILTEDDFVVRYNVFKNIEARQVKEYYEAISFLEPFGQDNARPLFEVGFNAVDHPSKKTYFEVMKDKYLKLFGPSFVSAISFNEDMAKIFKDLNCPRNLNIKGYLSTNKYNGWTNYQVNIVNF